MDYKDYIRLYGLKEPCGWCQASGFIQCQPCAHCLSTGRKLIPEHLRSYADTGLRLLRTIFGAVEHHWEQDALTFFLVIHVTDEPDQAERRLCALEEAWARAGNHSSVIPTVGFYASRR